MNQTADTEKYRKSSKRAAWIVLAVFLVVMAAMAYNVTRLSAIDAAISEQEAQVGERLKTIVALEEEVERLTYAPGQRPNAHAEEIPDIRDNRGRQMYDFMLWIDLAGIRNREITEVIWVSDSQALGEVATADRTNGFSVNYRGAECLESVRVSLRYRDGSEEKTDFDMCEALGW